MHATPRFLPTLATLALSAAFAPLAQAGCGDSLLQAPTASTLPAPSAAKPIAPRDDDRPAHMMSIGYRLPVSDRAYSNLGIVGMWHFQYIAGGKVVDDGYQTWHADRTETINSGKPASTGNFCMGVWKPTGPSSYKINHYALNWNPDNTFVGVVNIKEEVTLESGDAKFDGTFTLDQYDPTGKTLLAHVAGTVVATRIVVE